MTEAVLPLEMILFQVLFLLVAIALEARVLHRKLKMSRRTSVEYAISLNLFATAVGWLTFFFLENLLPNLLKVQLISFIFFDRLIGSQVNPGNSLMVLVGMAIFLFTFLFKLLGLELLQAWLQTPPAQPTTKPKVLKRRPGLLNRTNQIAAPLPPNSALVLLLANTYSYSAILLLLFLRFLHFNTLG